LLTFVYNGRPKFNKYLGREVSYVHLTWNDPVTLNLVPQCIKDSEDITTNSSSSYADSLLQIAYS